MREQLGGVEGKPWLVERPELISGGGGVGGGLVCLEAVVEPIGRHFVVAGARDRARRASVVVAALPHLELLRECLPEELASVERHAEDVGAERPRVVGAGRHRIRAQIRVLGLAVHQNGVESRVQNVHGCS